MEKRNKEDKICSKGKKRQESEKTKKETKGNKRKRQDKKRESHERKIKKKGHTSRPEELTKDGIGPIEASSTTLGRERNTAKKSGRSYAIL